jgi:hypothetical protein
MKGIHFSGRKILWMSFFPLVTIFMTGNAFAADPPQAEYEAALAEITDGSYYLATEVNGTKFYITQNGYLTDDKETAYLFDISKVNASAAKDRLFDVAFNIDPGNGAHFSNTTLVNGKAFLYYGAYRQARGNNRDDWERQIFYLNAEGKYAIRSCNTIYGENSWNDAGRAFWTWEIDNPDAYYPVPCYSYEPAYIWSLELPDELPSGQEVFEYIITGDNSVSVKAKTVNLMGDIEIPSITSIDGKMYQVTSIADSGFQNCNKITSVVLPNTIEVIDCWAFSYCTSLKKVSLPKSLTEICSWAFYGCSSLERLDIPRNVKTFGWGVLSGDCNQLKEITVADGNNSFKMENGLLLNTAGTTAYAYAFGSETEHLIIPGTVTSLNLCALFKGNKRLITINIPSSVTFIGGDTFNGCTALEEVTLPDGIQTIQYSAFYGCTSLKGITIPAALMKVSDDIFSGCTAIKSVTVRQNNPLEITSSFFPNEVYANATLYIPKGRRAYYANATGWKEFKNLKEIQMDGIASSDSPYDNIENNQMILGYYSSNECQLAGEDGYGGPQGGLYKVCIGFSKDQIAPFAGNHIKNVRFGLVHTEDMSGVQLWIGSSRDKKDLYTQSINNLQTGWNEIELVDPYTITEDSIFVGIEYRTQYSNYPISCVTTGKEKGSSYFYGPYNNGVYSWLDTGESESLSMQCLIEGEKLPQNLIRALPPVVNSLYQKSGETISGNVSIKNWGKKNVEDYDIKYQIDGNDVEFTQWNKLSVGRNEYTSLYFELKVPQTLMAGQHRLTAVITQINGMPNQYHSEGGRPTSLKVYTKSYERKKVVMDHLTAQWCLNSVRADKEIEEIMSQHDDIILLTSNLQDNLSCDASETFGIFSEYIPAIYYDRYSSAGATSLGYTGYETAKQQPSLVTVDVSATYNYSDNKLHIKVQGERNDEFADVEGDANLTVLVTEDKIDAPQNDWETGGYDHYEHNGVIRGNASAIWGDPIQWNGNSYDMDFTMPYNR